MSDAGSILTAAGVRMPGIVYGTAWKKQRTAALVEQALAAGFRGIDTACQPKHYDEAGVGKGLAATLAAGLSRDAIYLQTKYTPPGGHDPARIPYDQAAPIAEQVRQSVEVSLANLRVDTIDGLILHSPLSTDAATLEAWRAMEAAVERGVVRQLGISNCYQLERLRRLHTAARIKPAVLQNRFYAETGYDRELRAFCTDQSIVYQSFWTLTANPGVLLNPSVEALAARYARTEEQLFFRYLTQRGIVPLTGTTSERHMREDLAIFEFELTADECLTLDGLF